MIDTPLKKAEAEQMIRLFSTDFYNKFGVNPVVVYDATDDARNVLKLSDIEEIMNEALKKVWDKGHPYPTISTKARFRDVVTYRHLYFYYARREGYHFALIADRIGYDHASAIHGTKTIENLIKSKDKILLKEIQKIDNAIKIRNHFIMSGAPEKALDPDQNFEETLP